MSETPAATAHEVLSREEVESFAREWYRRLDEHVPAADLLPMLDSDVEFHVPEGVQRGLAAFVELYEGDHGWTRSFFDEVHTLREVTVSSSGDRASVDVIVNWQARVWQPPAPRSQWIGFEAYQRWEMVRSGEAGRAVLLRYIVNELRPMPGSPSL
jgi:hypothetical protein